MSATPTPFQLHAMTVACPTCGAGVGTMCVPPVGPIPADACRVHGMRSANADAITGVAA